jgi:beta-barrel assembly-enhancing protease
MMRALNTAVRRRVTSAVVLAVLACSSGVAAFSLVSVQQEVEIGKQAQQEIRRQVPELRDEAVNRYIDGIGRRLAAHAPGAKYPYSFDVVNYKEINAFALPGGPIWVHRGAIDAARTEAQLAGVMAHEVAHIAERHAAAQLTKATIANGLLGLLAAATNDEGRGGAVARIGAGIAAQSVFMKFSRDDEREADRVGVEIMRRAGWDPHGMPEFLAVLRDQQQRSPGSVETFFSSHPAPAGRVTELQQVVGNRSGRRDSQEFQEIQRRLDAMPPAQSMPRGTN